MGTTIRNISLFVITPVWIKNLMPTTRVILKKYYIVPHDNDIAYCTWESFNGYLPLENITSICTVILHIHSIQSILFNVRELLLNASLFTFSISSLSWTLLHFIILLHKIIDQVFLSKLSRDSIFDKYVR